MNYSGWFRDRLILPIVLPIISGIAIASFEAGSGHFFKERRDVDVRLEGPMDLSRLGGLMGVLRLLFGNNLSGKALEKLEEVLGEDPGTIVEYEVQVEYKLQADGSKTSPKIYFNPKQIDNYAKDSDVPLTAPLGLSVSKVRVNYNELYLYNIYIKNSGDIELKDITGNISFLTDDNDFSVVSHEHYTKPKIMSETVKYLKSSNPRELKYRYTFLNPGEEDQIIILATKPCSYAFELRASGYSISKFSDSSESDNNRLKWLMYPLIALFSSWLIYLLYSFVRWRFYKLRQAKR